MHLVSLNAQKAHVEETANVSVEVIGTINKICPVLWLEKESNRYSTHRMGGKEVQVYSSWEKQEVSRFKLAHSKIAQIYA